MPPSAKKPTTPKATPGKPHPDFPLYQHPSGQWCKKLKGRAYYFGSWRSDPQGTDAHTRYIHELPYLLRGEDPPPMDGEGYTVRDVVDLWVGRKKERIEAGKLVEGTYNRYYALGQEVLRQLGEDTPADVSPAKFELLRLSMEARLSTETLHNDMGAVISMFKLAHKKGYLSRLPDFEECFERPTSLQLRAAQEESGASMFTPAEIHRLLEVADDNLRAMILLGLNGGLGNSDLTELTIDHVRKEPGWLNYPRHKTAVRRRIPLWSETTAAINQALASRPEPRDKEDARILFINRLGKSYRDNRRGILLCWHFAELTANAGVADRTFYDLRRTFQTVADGCLDFVAVSAVMGHAPSRRDMPTRYRQMVSDERLQSAVNAVRDWLYSSNGANVKRKAVRKGTK